MERMPNDPDQNVEEQLKAWAAARRDEAGGPFELHPAMRKQLQDEVARSFSAEEPVREHRPGWLALLRPRFAFALSVVAAMVVIGVALWPSLSPSAPQSRQLLAHRGEGELQDRTREIPGKTEVPAEPAAVPATPALAVNAPAQSPDKTTPLSRADRFGEARQTFDAPSGPAKNSREQLERVDTAAIPRPAPEEKAKEVALARDTTKLSGRDASGASGRQESAAAQFGWKSSDGAGLGGAAAATAGRKSGEPTLALRSSAPAPDVRGKRPAAAATLPAASTLNEKDSLLNYQKAQPVAQLDALSTITEANRQQASNALGFVSLATGSATQQFTQMARYRRNFNSPPLPKVLTSFQLEQRGRQVRIVDADGSVYEGEFTAEAGSAVPAPLAGERLGDDLKKTDVTGQTGLAAGVAESGQKANFRAEGMNRTLNQPLVFTGNLWVPNIASAAGAVGEAPQQGVVQLQQVNTSRTPSQQNVPRVQGQATIGSDRLEINAVQAGP